MGSGQQADQRVVEFVSRAILDRLLGNLHRVLNRLKQLHSLSLMPRAAKLAQLLNCLVVAVVDSFMMMLLLSLSFHSSIGMAHHPSLRSSFLEELV